MKPTRAELEDQAERFQTQLDGLRSYIKELREMASRHDTDEGLLEEDLHEAEHNASYYEAELERISGELGGAPFAGGPAKAPGSILPLTPGQGVGALALVSIGFVAGLLVGGLLNPRKGD